MMMDELVEPGSRTRKPAYWSPAFHDLKQRHELLHPELCRLRPTNHIAELSKIGYTVVRPGTIGPASHVAALRGAVLWISQARSDVVPDLGGARTQPGQDHPLGQFMRHVLFDDPVFKPLLTNPVLLGLITYLVGFDAFLSLYDAMLKGPGGPPLALHNDNGDKTTPVYADQPQTANINFLLIDYDAASGPIAFVPGSHRLRREPKTSEMRELASEMIPVLAPAESAVVWPANTWHTALPRAAPGLRATIPLNFCRGHLQPQSPFRIDVSDEVLARNPPRFAQLVHCYGAFPFRREDIDCARAARGGERHSLFDCHPVWRDHFGL